MPKFYVNARARDGERMAIDEGSGRESAVCAGR
jgi:hypothetical protein